MKNAIKLANTMDIVCYYPKMTTKNTLADVISSAIKKLMNIANGTVTALYGNTPV